MISLAFSYGSLRQTKKNHIGLIHTIIVSYYIDKIVFTVEKWKNDELEINNSVKSTSEKSNKEIHFEDQNLIRLRLQLQTWRLELMKIRIDKIIVPTFDKKVTEYLCSELVFFLQTNFDFLTSHF